MDSPAFAWRTADGGTSATITVGGTVTFAYPSGSSVHSVAFTGDEPSSCEDVAAIRPAPWQGRCEFQAAGTYPFVCGVHPEMTGRVVVQRPASTRTPTPTPTPTATPTPGASATPQPSPTPTPAPGEQSTQQQAALSVRLARAQRGTRVRGRVDVQHAGSRLEVTLRRGRVRAGRMVRTAGAGVVSFSVPVNARSRRVLRRRGRLDVKVTIALTPPGGTKMTRDQRVRLRR